MGKVKVKVVGDEQAEQEALDEQKKKREQKALDKKNKVKGVGLGGGERINSIGATEEDILAEVEGEKTEKADTAGQTKALQEEESKPKAKSQKSKAKNEARTKSKRYQENKSQVAARTTYPLSNAVEILRKFKNSKFDETVELHINVREKGVHGAVTLPHGTGKELKIVIADDAIISEVEKGKINFDILVAHPSMMPKLAKVAKILGPRGLMPNPKAGTITDKPEDAVKKLAAGQVAFKTESGGPIIHMSVGKVSFKDNQIEDNVKAALNAIGASKISTVTLKSTMSPGIRLQV